MRIFLVHGHIRGLYVPTTMTDRPDRGDKEAPMHTQATETFPHLTDKKVGTTVSRSRWLRVSPA